MADKSLEELQKELKGYADDFIDENERSGIQEVGALIHRLLKKTESLPFLLKVAEDRVKELEKEVMGAYVEGYSKGLQMGRDNQIGATCREFWLKSDAKQALTNKD